VTTDDVVRVDAIVTNRGSTADDGITVNFTLGDGSAEVDTGSISDGSSTTVSETFSFREGDEGTFDVTVEGPTNEFNRTVTVAAAVQDLQLETDRSPVTAGTDLNFTVRADGDLVDAQLEIDGETYEVTDGTANISTGTSDEPETLTPGDYTVVATKAADEETETNYNSDSDSVTVEAPADIEVDDAYRLVTQAYTGDNVTIEAVVVNNGDLQGEETINLTDSTGEVLDNEIVNLAGNANTTITLNTTFNETGSPTLSVGDEVAGEVEIDPQTVVTDYTLTNTSVTVGEQETTINATVRNRGSTLDESFAVNLSVGGEADVDNATVTDLGSGEVDYVEFTRTFDTVGRTPVTVNEEPPTSVLVTEQIVDLSVEVETENPTIDDEVVFNVTDSNGDAVEDATIVARGQVLETNESGLANASFATGTVSASVTADGDQISYNPDSVEFTVNRPANVLLLGADVTSEDTVYQGETVDVSVDLLNLGGVTGERNVTLNVSGTTADYSVRSVDPGDSETVTLSAQLNDTGEQTLTATHNGTDAEEEATVDVQPAAVVANYTVNQTAISVDDAVRVQANVTNRGKISDSTEVDVSIDPDANESYDPVTVDVATGKINSTNFTCTFADNATRTV
jgi:hypothetical protein